MVPFDVENLLEPISADEPCGEDLEYDSAFGELTRAAQSKPEQQYGSTIIPAVEPDWRAVQKAAIALFDRTLDLRVAFILAQAATSDGGFVGFAAASGVVRGLVERYWDTVFPVLDPDDDNDPTVRVNIVQSLSDQSTFLKWLHKAPLVESRAVGRFGLRDIEAVADGSNTNPDVSAASIDAAFQDVAVEALQATADAVEQGLANARAIEETITERVGAANAPNLEDLVRLLRQASKALVEQLRRRGVKVAGADEDAAPDSAAEGDIGGEMTANGLAGGEGVTGPAVPGRIASRADVVAALDKICDYYDRVEPSSPVPVLLLRAQGLVHKNFLELLEDLAPGGISQFEVYRAPPSG